MARPKAFDPEDILDRATALFWTRGYEATSVQDLVDFVVARVLDQLGVSHALGVRWGETEPGAETAKRVSR